MIKNSIEYNKRKITQKTRFYISQSTSPSMEKLETKGKTTVDEMFSG